MSDRSPGADDPHAALWRDRVALDLGCGAGVEAVALAAAGWRVTGIDGSAGTARLVEKSANAASSTLLTRIRALEDVVARNPYMEISAKVPSNHGAILKKDHRTDFYRCLTEKLLTYALGRGLEYYDVQTVDQIVERLGQEDGRFSALLMGIIESAPFQKRRNLTNVATEAVGRSKPRNPIGSHP